MVKVLCIFLVFGINFVIKFNKVNNWGYVDTIVIVCVDIVNLLEKIIFVLVVISLVKASNQ